MGKRLAWAGGGIGLLALVLVAGLAVQEGLVRIPGQSGCTASVGGREVDLTVDQAENAALITAISVKRGLPARAASIALATAYQESKIINIDFGDRDSLGLFQQRPSQGWGTEAQVQDPVYATNKFYDALVEIDGYESMPITEAAQAVQRSAFPDAYADHAEDGRVLASALTGNSPDGAFTCTVDDTREEESDELDDAGLTKRAATVRRDLKVAFGNVPLGGFDPDGVSSGHQEGSAHYDGRAIDAFFRPVNQANKRRGWAMAGYLVAQSDRLDIDTVIFDDKIWTSRRSGAGWREYNVDTDGRDARTAAILEHRDHVHVDVAD
ncbi:hypothetical protein [Nocardioides pacificus]